jgi:hypothetical protein
VGRDVTESPFQSQTFIEDPVAPEAPGDTRRRGLPFAARVQGILIAVMCLALILIAQQRSKDLYQIGLPMLVVAAFLQIAFGNIPPRTGAARSLLLLFITWAIIGLVFAVSIYLTPELIKLSRSES